MNHKSIIYIINKENITCTFVYQDQKLIEFAIQDSQYKNYINNIYKGRVVRILQQHNACFVDVGDMHVFVPLKHNVYLSQDLIVQVTSSSHNTRNNKAPVATTNIKLVGKLAVLVSNLRQIIDKNKILQNNNININTKHKGFIIRTNASYVDNDNILANIKLLDNIYTNIQSTSIKHGLLYKADPLHSEVINNYIDPIIVNQNLTDISSIDEHNKDLHTTAIKDLLMIINSTVTLKNNTSLHLEQTETLNVIDVDTSLLSGFDANIAVIQELYKQINIRNLQGIILIDFAKMNSNVLQNSLLQETYKVFSQDKRIKIIGFNELGILQITRKKQGVSVADVLFYQDIFSQKLLRSSVKSIIKGR